MTVIVTGGAGFIGSHVVDALLARGDEVHVVDDLSNGHAREACPPARRCTCTTFASHSTRSSRETGAEAIVHLAAQADVRVSVAEPALDAAINVLGTVNVLEAARLAGARVVFASTGGAIYGECARPARENDPCLPLSPYGAAKLAGEGYLGAFARLHGMPHVALRFGNVYGPRQDPHGEAGVVAIFLGQLLEASRMPDLRRRLPEPRLRLRGRRGAGDDAALDSDAGGVFNVGTGIADVGARAVRTPAARSPGSDATPVHEPARAGELGAERPRPRACGGRDRIPARRRRSPKASQRPGGRCDPTLRALLAVGAPCSSSREGARRRRANVLPWTSPYQHDDRLDPTVANGGTRRLRRRCDRAARPRGRRRRADRKALHGRHRPPDRQAPGGDGLHARRAKAVAAVKISSAPRSRLRTSHAGKVVRARAQRQRPPGRRGGDRVPRLAARLPHRWRRERAQLRFHAQPRHVPPGLRRRGPAPGARSRNSPSSGRSTACACRSCTAPTPSSSSAPSGTRRRPLRAARRGDGRSARSPTAGRIVGSLTASRAWSSSPPGENRLLFGSSV